MKTQSKVGFAVVGLGAISRTSVLPAFGHARRARLIALVSRERSKAMDWARRYRAESAYAASEFAACLKDPRVEAVYIATPPGTHLELTAQAARAGKHVLCEKPLAADSLQSKAMVEICKKNRVLLMTAYRKYFEPSACTLKKLVQGGELGRIDMIHSAFSEQHVAGKSLDWLLNRGLAGGGPLMDLGIYCVNTGRWLLDENPMQAIAVSWKHDAKRFRDVEEGISFRLEFPSGPILQASTTYNPAISSFVFVQGTKGWACLTPAFTFDEPRRLTGKIRGRAFERTFKVIDEFAPELDAFSSAMRSGKPVEPDGAEGHRDMRIIEAIYRAAEEHRAVPITY